MRTDRHASEEGLHIRYVGREAYWIDGLVLFVASIAALIVGCWTISVGVSATTVSRTIVWLALPWFVALYFLARKLRNMAEGGFEVVLNFGSIIKPTASLAVVIVALHILSAFLLKF